MAYPRAVKADSAAVSRTRAESRVPAGCENTGRVISVISPRRDRDILALISAMETLGRARRYESFVRAASGVRSRPNITPALPRSVPGPYMGETNPLVHWLTLTTTTPRSTA